MVDARGRRRHVPAQHPPRVEGVVDVSSVDFGCEPVFFSTLVVAHSVPVVRRLWEIPESLARAKTRAASPGVILNRYGLFPGYM